MKLKEQLRMLVILLAMPLAFVACDNNDDENGAPIVAEKGDSVFITCLRRLMNAN